MASITCTSVKVPFSMSDIYIYKVLEQNTLPCRQHLLQERLSFIQQNNAKLQSAHLTTAGFMVNQFLCLLLRPVKCWRHFMYHDINIQKKKPWYWNNKRGKNPQKKTFLICCNSTATLRVKRIVMMIKHTLTCRCHDPWETYCSNLKWVQFLMLSLY